MLRHRDHHRNVGAQGALDQVGKAFSLALLASEPVDDYEIGSLIDGTRHLRARVQELPKIQPASWRNGYSVVARRNGYSVVARRNGLAVVACGAGAEILEQLQLFTAVDQDGGQFWRIGTMVAELNQPDRPVSPAAEVGGKAAQHLVRILILVIDQRRKIALGVKHDEPRFPPNVCKIKQAIATMNPPRSPTSVSYRAR
jgi:hypothetical protein